MTGRGGHRWRAANAFTRRLRRESGGAAAVEFALVLPVVLVLYLGAFEISQAVAVYTKLSDLTTELATVASQDSAYSKVELDTINAASAQVMAPYPTASLTIATTEFTTDPVVAGKGTVVASRGLTANVAGSPHKIGDVLNNLPATLLKNTGYILVDTSYTYTLSVGANFINSIPTMSDRLYFLPRAATTDALGDKSYANYNAAPFNGVPFIGQTFVPCSDCD